MNSISESSINHERVKVASFPDELTPGSIALIAGAVDPSTYALGLRALCQYGQPNETGLVVTTTESADQTVDTCETICESSARPKLNLVDTTSEQQYLPAVYEETLVVFTPSPSDLERLVLALTNLTEHRSSSNSSRHLVVRSLTPYSRIHRQLVSVRFLSELLDYKRIMDSVFSVSITQLTMKRR